MSSTATHLEEPSLASGSRTPRPITLSPSPPCSPRSMTRTMEPDSMVLLRTIDFAARVCLFLDDKRRKVADDRNIHVNDVKISIRHLI